MTIKVALIYCKQWFDYYKRCITMGEAVFRLGLVRVENGQFVYSEALKDNYLANAKVFCPVYKRFSDSVKLATRTAQLVCFGASAYLISSLYF